MWYSSPAAIASGKSSPSLPLLSCISLHLFWHFFLHILHTFEFLVFFPASPFPPLVQNTHREINHC